MNDGRQMRVVEIENVARDAVHQRSVQYVGAVGSAEHGRLRWASEGEQRGKRGLHSLMLRRADGTAEPVDDRTHALALRVFGHIAWIGIDEPARERASHFHEFLR